MALHSKFERVWCLKKAKALTLKNVLVLGNGNCYYRAIAVGLVVARSRLIMLQRLAGSLLDTLASGQGL